MLGILQSQVANPFLRLLLLQHRQIELSLFFCLPPLTPAFASLAASASSGKLGSWTLVVLPFEDGAADRESVPEPRTSTVASLMANLYG